MVPGRYLSGYLRGGNRGVAMTVRNSWQIAGPTINNGGVNVPIGPSPLDFAGSNYVVQASTYNFHKTHHVTLDFIPSQNRFNAKNQIAMWISSDPNATTPTTDQAVRQQCLAAQGTVFHSEFTRNVRLTVPPRRDYNFSTGQGDNATGTAFEPQGRIFVVPLAGTDTSDFTYGTLNITFHGELSGPGTPAAPATVATDEDPFTFGKLHNFTNWSLASRATVHERVNHTTTPLWVNYWLNPPYNDATTNAYYYDPGNLPPDDVVPDSTRYAHVYLISETAPTAGTLWEYNTKTETWERALNNFGTPVIFPSGTKLPVTTQYNNTQLSFESLGVGTKGNPLITSDENGNEVLAAQDDYLRNKVAEFLTQLTKQLTEQANTNHNDLTNINKEFDNLHVTVDNKTLPVNIENQPIQTTSDDSSGPGILDILGAVVTLV